MDSEKDGMTITKVHVSAGLSKATKPKGGSMFRGVAVVLMLAMVCTGCATILKSGKTEMIPVRSTPERADVYLDGNLKGQTPTTVAVSAKQRHQLEFRKEGYNSVVVDLKTHVQAGWIILDIIFGIAPLIVDAATGSWKSLNDKYFEVRMEEKK